MKPVKTGDGWEIRDGETVIVTTASWPPRDPDNLETLFEEANISTPQKELFKILFGVVEPEDETSQS